ncbi:hypothetical protein LIA77_11698 [Sarocladium implicatum]|nr:hypothetical protein LIA77_11698 [Sarocladium implicatum]
MLKHFNSCCHSRSRADLDCVPGVVIASGSVTIRGSGGRRRGRGYSNQCRVPVEPCGTTAPAEYLQTPY